MPGASELASLALQVCLKVTADCNLSDKKGKHGEVLAHVIPPITIFIKSSSYGTLYVAQHLSASYTYRQRLKTINNKAL